MPTPSYAVSMSDVFWLGVCALLSFACVVALSFWLFRIFRGQVDSSRMTMLGYTVAIYALCIGGGWLWGRYQQSRKAEETQRQLELLQWQVDQLLQSKQSLQQALQKALEAPPKPDETLIGRRGQGIVPDALPQKIARVEAAPSIYEQQIDPPDSSDLPTYPHEKYFPLPGERDLLDYGWRLIGASRRGFGHGFEGKYREDDFQIKIFPGKNHPSTPAVALVALADGVGSKHFSRWGARAAVQGATSLAEEQINPLRLLNGRQQEALMKETRNILLEALKSAYENILRCARQAQVQADELQSTLQVFLAVALSPEQLFLACVQIGDGALFALQASPAARQPVSARWQLLLQPQIQSAGNEVQAFLQSNEKEWNQFLRYYLLDSTEGVMGMTDGIADDIEAPPPSAHDPRPDPFVLVDDFHQRIIVPAIQSPRPGEALLQQLAYRKKQSYDDRTLVYLYRQ